MVRPPRLLATLVAVLLGATVLAGCSSTGSISLTASFDDVGDLVAQHSVQLADVRIGSISSIELTDDYRALVTFTVDDDVRIPVDSTAFISKTSLLGEKFVELRPNGDPTEGPFLSDGDHLGDGIENPELEFVADQAITLLGAVVDSDLRDLIASGAVAFGGRGPELRSIVEDLSTISATLAERSGRITAIIDGLDRAAATLARGSGTIGTLLVNLAETTETLVDNREQTLTALEQLSRLAAVQNDLLDTYRDDMSLQIGQVNDILAQAASASGDLDSLLGWLAEFTTRVPLAIPEDFTQVYMWAQPASEDERAGTGAGG